MSRTLLDECKDGNIHEVECNIAYGADIEKIDIDGRTPLYIASKNGHLEIVKVLIASGALLDKANADGRTPLCRASDEGHLEIVMLLIANKANFIHINNEGKTPLDLAKTNEIRECIMNHPWYRRRPLLLTRPHNDHETNEEHDVTSLGDIITATKGDDSSNQNDGLFQIKIKIASFL